MYFTFMATLSAENIWIPDLRGKCVAYLRSSTRPRSRLKPDAQRVAIKAALIPGKTKLIAEFTDHEPLRDNDRPEFLRAIEHCKLHEATLLIGQVDRMRSNVRWLGLAQQAGIKFRGADARVYKGRKPTVDVAQVRSLRDQGLGATDIATKLRIARASVYRALKDDPVTAT